MFCPYCGVKIPGGKRRCPNCGADMHQETDELMAVSQPSQAVPAVPASTESSLAPVENASAVAADQAQMPAAGPSLALVILGCVFGLIWGFLSLSHYSDLKRAIEVGDVETACRKVRSIRHIAIMGAAVNILIIAGIRAGRGY